MIIITIEKIISGELLPQKIDAHSAIQEDLNKLQKWQDNWNLMLSRPHFSFRHTRSTIHSPRSEKKIAEQSGIEFYYEDFREGYQESRDISKDLGLYMQKYCGCIFSEKERYLKKKPQFL